MQEFLIVADGIVFLVGVFYILRGIYKIIRGRIW